MVSTHGFQRKAEEIILKPQENMKPWLHLSAGLRITWGTPRKTLGVLFSKRRAANKTKRLDDNSKPHYTAGKHA